MDSECYSQRLVLAELLCWPLGFLPIVRWGAKIGVAYGAEKFRVSLTKPPSIKFTTKLMQDRQASTYFCERSWCVCSSFSSYVRDAYVCGGICFAQASAALAAVLRWL